MTPSPPPFGSLLVRLRLARGWSQRLLAARLCAASGVPTLTRHEISRWERQLRVPGEFWLGWLAVVLDVPVGLLSDAAARCRRARPARPGAVFPPGPPGTLVRPGARSRAALLALARRWLADPRGSLLIAPPRPPAVPPAGGATATPAPTLARLRRLDDLVGGADLLGYGLHRLRRATRELSVAGPAARRRLLPVLAESAQLAGWLAADASRPTHGLDAYRLGLRAAAAAGDVAFGGHVLGAASHLLAGVGDASGALLLARTGYAGAHRSASPGLRALLLHRVALAAALGGHPATARRALAAAERAADAVEPAREPPWLYWLDGPELAGMTGRTLVALGQPRPAAPLLAAALRPGLPRGTALYGGWLARAHLQLGDVERACAATEAALLAAIRAGSPRAAGLLAEVGRRLAEHTGAPAVRQHAALAAAAARYLPAPVARPHRAAGTPAATRRSPGSNVAG